jgi:hypothetical protein
VRSFANNEKDEFKICIDASKRNVRYRGDQFFKGDVEYIRKF